MLRRRKSLRVKLRFIGRRKPTCPHEWEFYEPEPRYSGDYTGFLEQCCMCGEIVQVPQ